jgi:hypothetical protein
MRPKPLMPTLTAIEKLLLDYRLSAIGVSFRAQVVNSRIAFASLGYNVWVDRLPSRGSGMADRRQPMADSR